MCATHWLRAETEGICSTHWLRAETSSAVNIGRLLMNKNVSARAMTRKAGKTIQSVAYDSLLEWPAYDDSDLTMLDPYSLHF